MNSSRKLLIARWPQIDSFNVLIMGRCSDFSMFWVMGTV